MIKGESATKKIQELTGKNAAAFATSLLQIVNSNELLQNSTPESVFNAACMAATLNLPINNNLGFAYIVPFKSWKTGKTEAQFQLGYKGFIQLAQRSGQFKRITACPVFDGDTEEDVKLRLTSLIPKKPSSSEIVGYIAYFELLNGYEASLTMTTEELWEHAEKYSQTLKNEKARKNSIWATNFEAMARKTVIKLLLSQQAPMSIDMQKAVLADQAIVKDVSGEQFEYIDNQPEPSAPQEIGKQPIDEAMFSVVVERVQTGSLSFEDAIAMYDLTDEQYEQLSSL